MTIVAVTYAAELVREARVGRFPYEALSVQVALESLVVLLLLVAALFALDWQSGASTPGPTSRSPEGV